MHLINAILGLLDIGAGLLCIAISIPLLRGSVGVLSLRNIPGYRRFTV